MVILFFDPRGYEGKVVQVVIEIYMSADTSHAKERAKDLWEKRNIKQFIFMRYVNEKKLKNENNILFGNKRNMPTMVLTWATLRRGQTSDEVRAIKKKCQR